MIELKNIEKIYPNGFSALKNVNLKVQKGEIRGIIGYSGAGKSTLIRCINLLERPSSGEVIVNGVNLLNLSQKDLTNARRKIGMIFQHFNLLSARNVAQNVAYALEIANWQKDLIMPRVNELLDMVGLKNKANSKISELSGGQKQRVAIARALANSPEVLLCDEATSALDTKTTQEVLGLLKGLKTELGLTIVLITHQMEVVKQIADNVCVIQDGKIVEEGRVVDIFAAPKQSVTKELLGYESPSIVLDEDDIYRIIFTGSNTHKPLISTAIKKFDIDINIISGNVDELRSGEVGHLNVRLLGEKSQIEQTLEFFKSVGLSFVKIGEKR